ncbi:MAG: PrsW family glutamic-type intramembrane protease [Opitutales bacterium]
MNFGLLALAIGPSLAIAMYVYWRDKHEKEPLGLLVKCFLLGALTIIPIMIVEGLSTWLLEIDLSYSLNLPTALVTSFLLIGLTEEAFKYLVLTRYAYPKPDFNEPFDGIVYSVMISLGFATVENILYVIDGGVGVGILRMFTAVPMHAACGVIMGYSVGMAKFQRTSRIRGLGYAMLFHRAYDFFLLQDITPYMNFLIIPVMIYAIRLSRKAMREHLDASPFKNQDLANLDRPEEK